MQAPAYAAPSYDLDHLEQFSATNSCSGCDLTGANLSRTKHRNAFLTGADLSQSKLSHANFEQTNFSTAVLIRTQAQKTKFMKAIFDGGYLLYMDGSNSYFSGASFRNCNLNYAKLSRANLSSTDFSGATLVNADLSQAILIGAKITSTQLHQTKKLECAVLPDGTVYNPNHIACR